MFPKTLSLFLILEVFVIHSALAESFSCHDYYNKTTLDVTYDVLGPQSRQITGTFVLQSDLLQEKTVYGQLFNYDSVPDQYSLYSGSCTQESGERFCSGATGTWIAATGGYQLTYENIDVTVSCTGEVP